MEDVEGVLVAALDSLVRTGSMVGDGTMGVVTVAGALGAGSDVGSHWGIAGGKHQHCINAAKAGADMRRN